ncbi:DUF6456 domain-containing protein [Pseudovibrio sp. Tun.PSC04-5.I4]|uniref:DUF6456 domain-containing protein n=1 Tax=Pseudovibrio sp. Tun.PSC04-5.I4 TaxID=1798213 RepID=UPI0008891D32|nr:DUF6456 domain-containing protein [Pseudovibrio sp. Tun.PSC04-5.I4]SDQ88399.1 hypothetical protein SAMN04515695_1765 [Pseudovibrio sp. Tun.PSC04-5.I4]
MQLGHEEQLDMIKLCKLLAGSNSKNLKVEQWQHTISPALAIGFIEPQQNHYQLTSSGKQWLRKMLSSGGLELSEEKSCAVPSSAPVYNTAESPLAWLRSRKDRSGVPFLSDRQFDAGERLREDFTYAQLLGNVRSNWKAEQLSRSTAKLDDVTESAYDARRRVEKAMNSVGPELAGVLLDVCCFLKSLRNVESERQWPQRTAKVVLCLGLDRLANHYGSSRNCAVGPDKSQLTSWHALVIEPEQQPHHP